MTSDPGRPGSSRSGVWTSWTTDHHLLSSASQFDTNGDGMISTAELREAMKKLLGQQVQTLWGRGWVGGPAVLLSLLLHSHLLPDRLPQVGHRDLEDILRDIDLNGDGQVDFEGENSPPFCVCCEPVLQCYTDRRGGGVSDYLYSKRLEHLTDYPQEKRRLATGSRLKVQMLCCYFYFSKRLSF